MQRESLCANSVQVSLCNCGGFWKANKAAEQMFYAGGCPGQPLLYCARKISRNSCCAVSNIHMSLCHLVPRRGECYMMVKYAENTVDSGWTIW